MTDRDHRPEHEAGWETLDPRRHFDTWDVDHPSALVHLPAGLRVHVCAYSDRAGAFTRFPAGPQVGLGARTLDGERVDFTATHEGTELALRFEQTGANTARVTWRTERSGEWGLRFWVVVVLETTAFGNDPKRVQGWLDGDVTGLRWSDGQSEPCASVAGARPPLLVTSHQDLESLEHEYESRGYWYLGSRGVEGPLLALRYNLEEMPENCLAIGVGLDASDTAAVTDRVRAALGPMLAGPAPGPTDDRQASGRKPEAAAQESHASLRPDQSEASGGMVGSTPEDPHGPLPPPHPPRPYSRRPAILAPPGSSPTARPRLHTGRYDGALDAIRDVIGWNTVFDPVNRRPYTALSRNWSSAKFGGFGVWLDDVLYHACLAGMLDLELAEENLRAVFAGRTEAGNLPCLLTGRDAWVDRSQPPIGAFVLWLLYRRWGVRRLLEDAWETLLANHEWWWRERDGNANALLEYGTSPVGDGLYRGTALAARDESSMDNSPVHDEAVLVPGGHTLDCEDVGLNSLVVLDGEMLALVASELGHESEAQRLAARARALAGRIGEALWDPEREVFANRLWSGLFVASIAPTSFFPLLAGAASPAQARALLAWLKHPRRFGGRFVLPSVTRDDPAYGDNVYWRGRIWPPLNFLVYQGLRRYGFDAEACAVAGRSYEMFAGPWRTSRHCAENYGAEDGAVTDQPDTDTFYGWGALMPALAVAEVCDVSPWDGWSIVNTGEDVRMGPVRCPSGWVRCEVRRGVLSVHVDDRPVLRTNARGRFCDIRLEAGSLRLTLPPSESTPDEASWLELPGVPVRAVSAARLDGESGDDLAVAAGPEKGARVVLPERPESARVEVAWRS